MAESGILERLMEIWNNKVFNIGLASGYAIAAKVSASDPSPVVPYKTLADIPITEMFSHDLSAQTAFGIVGGLYVFIKLLEAIRFFSFVAWAWRKIVGA